MSNIETQDLLRQMKHCEKHFGKHPYDGSGIAYSKDTCPVCFPKKETYQDGINKAIEICDAFIENYSLLEPLYPNDYIDHKIIAVGSVKAKLLSERFTNE